jgi:sorbose reductase
LEDVLSDFSQLDLFVANAGQAAYSGILDESVESWEKFIEAGLTGTLHW